MSQYQKNKWRDHNFQSPARGRYHHSNSYNSHWQPSPSWHGRNNHGHDRWRRMDYHNYPPQHGYHEHENNYHQSTRGESEGFEGVVVGQWYMNFNGGNVSHRYRKVTNGPNVWAGSSGETVEQQQAANNDGPGFSKDSFEKQQTSQTDQVLDIDHGSRPSSTVPSLSKEKVDCSRKQGSDVQNDKNLMDNRPEQKSNSPVNRFGHSVPQSQASSGFRPSTASSTTKTVESNPNSTGNVHHRETISDAQRGTSSRSDVSGMLGNQRNGASDAYSSGQPNSEQRTGSQNVGMPSSSRSRDSSVCSKTKSTETFRSGNDQSSGSCHRSKAPVRPIVPPRKNFQPSQSLPALTSSSSQTQKAPASRICAASNSSHDSSAPSVSAEGGTSREIHSRSETDGGRTSSSLPGKPKVDLRACKKKTSGLSKGDLMKLITSPRSRQDHQHLNKILQAHAERQKHTVHQASKSEPEDPREATSQLEASVLSSIIENGTLPPEIEVSTLPPEVQRQIDLLCGAVNNGDVEGQLSNVINLIDDEIILMPGDFSSSPGSKTGGASARPVAQKEAGTGGKESRQRSASVGENCVAASDSTAASVIVLDSPVASASASASHVEIRPSSVPHLSSAVNVVSHNVSLVPVSIEVSASNLTAPMTELAGVSSSVLGSRLTAQEGGTLGTVLQISLREDEIRGLLRETEGDISKLEEELNQLKECLTVKLNLKQKLMDEEAHLRTLRLMLLRDSLGQHQESSTVADHLCQTSISGIPLQPTLSSVSSEQFTDAENTDFVSVDVHFGGLNSVLPGGFINIEPIEDDSLTESMQDDRTSCQPELCFGNNNNNLGRLITIEPMEMGDLSDEEDRVVRHDNPLVMPPVSEEPRAVLSVPEASGPVHLEYVGSFSASNLQPQLLEEIARSLQQQPQHDLTLAARALATREFSCSDEEDETIEPSSPASTTVQPTTKRGKTANLQRTSESSVVSTSESDNCLVSKVTTKRSPRKQKRSESATSDASAPRSVASSALSSVSELKSTGKKSAKASAAAAGSGDERTRLRCGEAISPVQEPPSRELVASGSRTLTSSSESSSSSVSTKTLSPKKKSATDKQKKSSREPVLGTESNEPSCREKQTEPSSRAELRQVLLDRVPCEPVETESSEPLLGTRRCEPLLGTKPREPLLGTKPREPLLGAKPREPLLGLKPREPLLGTKPREPLLGIKPSEPPLGRKQSEPVWRKPSAPDGPNEFQRRMIQMSSSASASSINSSSNVEDAGQFVETNSGEKASSGLSENLPTNRKSGDKPKSSKNSQKQSQNEGPTKLKRKNNDSWGQPPAKKSKETEKAKEKKNQKGSTLNMFPSASSVLLYRHAESARNVVLIDDAIVTASDDGQIIRHPLPRTVYGLAEKKSFSGHAAGVVGLIGVQTQVSRNVKKAVVLSIGRDQTIQSHCLQTGRVMKSHKFDKGICYDCICEVADTIYVGLDDGSIARLATSTFAVKESLKFPSLRISCMAAYSKGNRHYLLVGFGDCSIMVRDTTSNSVVQTLRGHTRAPRFILTHGKYVVSSNGDCSVFLHVPKVSAFPQRTLYMPSAVVAMTVLDQPELLVVATRNKAIIFIDLHENRRYTVLLPQIEQPITCIAAGYRMIYFGCSSGFVYHLDLDVRTRWKCEMNDCSDRFFFKGDLEEHIREEHKSTNIPVLVKGQYLSICGWRGCTFSVSQKKILKAVSHYLSHLHTIEPETTSAESPARST